MTSPYDGNQVWSQHQTPVPVPAQNTHNHTHRTNPFHPSHTNTATRSCFLGENNNTTGANQRAGACSRSLSPCGFVAFITTMADNASPARSTNYTGCFQDQGNYSLSVPTLPDTSHQTPIRQHHTPGISRRFWGVDWEILVACRVHYYSVLWYCV